MSEFLGSGADDAEVGEDGGDVREDDAPRDDPAAVMKPTDLDLAALVEAWPDLPPAIRAGIVAMVKAATGKAGSGEPAIV